MMAGSNCTVSARFVAKGMAKIWRALGSAAVNRLGWASCVWALACQTASPKTAQMKGKEDGFMSGFLL